MRVYELHSDQPNALVLTDRPDPTPQVGQVLVKMHAASLNYRDLLVAKSAYGKQQTKSIVPLSDGAGEVVAVGAEVSGVRVGDRVAGIFMQSFRSGKFTAAKASSALGGGEVDGVLAEYVVFDEQGLVKIPDHLSYEEAATLPCAAVTAWNALVVEGQLTAGETVLLLGTGGVSVFALQFAKLLGAKVIITSSSDEKLDRARQLGADACINYKQTPDWEEKVWALTEGQGVDLVVEVGGADTLSRSLRAVRYGGTVALIGVLTGLGGDVKTGLILHKHVRVQGIYVGSHDMFEAMNQAIALHHLHPVVDRVFDFADAQAAFAYLNSAQHFGKVVIRIAT